MQEENTMDKDMDHTEEAAPAGDDAGGSMDTPSMDESAPADATDTDTTDAPSVPDTEDTNEMTPPADTGSSMMMSETQQPSESFMNFGVNTIYLMGTSFILGVLFTVFVLLILDFVRRNAEEDKK